MNNWIASIGKIALQTMESRRGTAILCALVALGAFFARSHATSYERIPASNDYAVEGRALDGERRPVNLIVFTDYQCPFCKALDDTIRALPHAMREKVRVFVRHLPLDRIHPYAVEAALAVECTDAPPMRNSTHEWLFANQDSIGITPWKEVARRVGMNDASAFERCIVEGSRFSRIRDDVQAATQLGLHGTPAMVLGDRLIRGVPGRTDLEQMLADALGGAK